MGGVISEIATATPEYRFSQNTILDFMIDAHQLSPSQAGRLTRIYESSGIQYRHSTIADFGAATGSYSFFGNEKLLEPFPTTETRAIRYEDQGWRIGKSAVEKVLRKSGLKPGQITHLITVSCTGMYAPGLDIDLVEKVGLPATTERTCINFMGCYGAFNALKTANYICRAEPSSIVLIVDVELCTLHFQRDNTLDNWVANSLFADGAAAVLVQPEESLPAARGLRLQSFYTELVSGAKPHMSWKIGDHGFEMTLSSQVSRNIKSKIRQVTDQLLSIAGLSLNDIARFAIHPGGRRILEVCEESLELAEETLESSYEVLRSYGNMSSATILFVLERMLGRCNPGERIASFAFGPGLTFESMVLESI